MLARISRTLLTTTALCVSASAARAQFTPYCFGDGSGTNCPCSNLGATGNGCANFLNSNGANLSASGFPSLSADTMTLTLTGATTASGCRFFQGFTQWNPPNGLPIYDGLRCISVPAIVLKNVAVVGGSAIYPSSSDPSISAKSFTAGLPIAVGQTVYYQVRYQDSNTFCTAALFNMTNAIATVWLP